MASRFLDRLKRSLFKDGRQPAAEEQEAGSEPEEEELKADSWEAELEEEEECVSDRLGGTLCFDVAEGEREGEEGEREEGEGEGGEGSGIDSDSDFLGESMEEGLSSTDISPVGVSPAGPSPSPSNLLTRHLTDSWRMSDSWKSLRGVTGSPALSVTGSLADSPAPRGRSQSDALLFEVTDASVVQEPNAKYVLYTIHVTQSGGSDKTPAVITRRYSDFQRLHGTLRRNHGDQMERVCFPRKRLHRNFTAETIAKRSRAFEQYLSHLCSLSGPRGANCVRTFFYMNDLHTGQLLIRVGRYQDALGPLLNAKRLQHKLGWACCHDSQSPPATPTTIITSFHWLFTLVGLSRCFQEVDQLEEAREHCDLALRVLAPPEANAQQQQQDADKKPEQSTTRDSDRKPNGPLNQQQQHNTDHRPHPLLLPLLRAVVRLSWQTGKDKRRWEGLLKQLEERGEELDNQPTVKEFLVKHNLDESEAEA